MKRKTFEAAACPVARALDVIGDAWAVLIVREAFVGPRRFGEFQTTLGVAKNILAVRLRKLVELGVLDRVSPDAGTHHKYALTEKGRGLFLVLMALRQWGEDCAGKADHVLIDRRDRRPVRPLTLVAHDGRPLGPGDVELVPAGPEVRPGCSGRAGKGVQ